MVVFTLRDTIGGKTPSKFCHNNQTILPDLSLKILLLVKNPFGINTVHDGWLGVLGHELVCARSPWIKSWGQTPPGDPPILYEIETKKV